MKTGSKVAIVIVVLVVAVGIGLLLLPGLSTSPTAAVLREIRISAGEVDLKGPYGYALEGQSVSSPGPTLRAKVGDRIRVTLLVTGQLPHTFNVLQRPDERERSIWGSDIGTPESAINPGQTKSVTFTAQRPGEYFYACLVPGHISVFKMFGNLIVES